VPILPSLIEQSVAVTYEVVVRRERGCPACTCPTAVLEVYARTDGQLYLMCDEVEECWTHPDRVGPAFDFNYTSPEIRGSRLATIEDIRRAGWDETLFEITQCPGKWTGA
jgi:hypothetical protein